MTEHSDYRLYLQTEFGHIKGTLEEIKIQTTRTNGRVTDLEKLTSTGREVIHQLQRDVKSLDSDIDELEAVIHDIRGNVNHTLDKCPQGAIIKEQGTLIREIKEWVDGQKGTDRSINKYVQIGGFVVAVIIAIIAWNNSVNRYNKLEKMVENINTPVMDTRSGKIVLYPSGALVDSIAKKK